MIVYATTRDDRMVILRDGEVRVTLEGRAPACVAVDGDRVLVGTRGHGVQMSADGGLSWARLDVPELDVYSVAFGTGVVYAGSEPSRLFVSTDGEEWRELEALQDIPSRDTWSFPPRPWTHHVRWIAPDPHDAQRLLVGIELGGLMRSDDGGASFSDHRAGAKRDAHSLAWHPTADGVAYQAAGDGAAWSHDGGVTWEPADAGRDLGYCWAVAADPADPERWYVSAASGPGAAHRGMSAQGRLYRWEGAWRALDLPSEAMPYALAARDGELLAGMSDGRLLRSEDRGDSWEELHAGLGSITAMAVA